MGAKIQALFIVPHHILVQISTVLPAITQYHRNVPGTDGLKNTLRTIFPFEDRAIPLSVQYMMDNKQDKDKTPDDLMKQFSYQRICHKQGHHDRHRDINYDPDLLFQTAHSSNILVLLSIR